MRGARRFRPGDTGTTPNRTERESWEADGILQRAFAGRSRGATPGELQLVADVYRANIDGNPTRAVKEDLGYASDRTAARRVERARAAGLLPPTTPGKRKA
jgi:hypothetical protein